MSSTLLRASAVALALGFAPLAGCDTTEPAGPDPEPDPQTVNLLPLEVGRQWVMSYTATDSTGQVLQTGVDTFAVTRDTTISGETWYAVEKLGRTPSSSCFADGLYANRADGLYTLVEVEGGGLSPSLYYATTVGPGTTYDLNVGVDTFVNEATMTFVAADDPFELPGVGTVSSYLYRRTTLSYGIGGEEYEGMAVKELRFSPEYGLLQHQGAYSSLRHDEDGGGQFVTIRRLDWKLNGASPDV